MAVHRKAGIGDAERIHPGDFRREPHHLPEREHDADDQHAEDQPVEAGIGEEGDPDLPVEHDRDQGAQDQEHQHADEKDPGRGQFRQGDFRRLVFRHVSFAGFLSVVATITMAQECP